MKNESPSRALDCKQRAITPLRNSPADDSEFAALAKALGHPARVRIVRILAAQDSCIAGDLQAEVGLAASTVSQHLRRLKDAGWVQGEIDGARRCYCLTPGTRDRFQALIEDIL